jgi:D-Tyr-tRNAtyr deacylase
MKEEKELLQKMVKPAVETEHQWIEKLDTVMVVLATTKDESRREVERLQTQVVEARTCKAEVHEVISLATSSRGKIKCLKSIFSVESEYIH